MGISPIEYRPWTGERTGYHQRLLAISKTIFKFKLKSKLILAIIILGIILVHVFPTIFYPMLPHEQLEPEVMVGARFDDDENGAEEIEGLSNEIEVDGDIVVEGEFVLTGSISVNGTIWFYGIVNLNGVIIGYGTLNGDGTEEGTSVSEKTINAGRNVSKIGTIIVRGLIGINGRAEGKCTMEGGDCVITGNGTLRGNMPLRAEREVEREPRGGDDYIRNHFFFIFTILLAAIVCADLIAEDLSSNSFVLYFSRPIKARDYLAGKMIGALWVMSIFCIFPPIIFCIAMIGTQSGDDYSLSLRVLSSTIGAGLLTAFMFIPYGIMISSITKRKAYAGIGTFISFFVLVIISSIFQEFDRAWALLDVSNILFYSYDLLYGYSLPKYIEPTLYGFALFAIMILPLIAVYARIHVKAVGK